MGLSADVLARRIRDAVRKAGVSQRQLAAMIDMDPTALSKALAGKRAFKSLEIALIAERLGLPTDELLADDDAEVRRASVLAARVQAGSAPVTQQAVRRVEQLRDLDALLTDLGRPAPPVTPVTAVTAVTALPQLARSPDPVRQGEALAEQVRAQCGLGDGDLPADPEDLATWLEDSLGIDVCIARLPSGLDGLALRSGRLRLALVSSGVSATRQRFTLGHEVCHLLAGDGQDLTIDEDVFGRPTTEERRANAFAAAFLMPAGAIREAAGTEPIGEDLVVSLLGRFRVSLDALAFRLHNVGVVNAAGRDRIRTMSSTRIALRPGRADDLQAREDRRAPGLLLARAMEAFAVGDLGVQPLAELLDVDPDRLLEELTPPRFVPGTDGSGGSAYAL